MLFSAKSRFVRYSPYKLRPLADVIRGKNAKYALDWLEACALQKALPLRKTVASAIANAAVAENVEPVNLVVKEIRVDEGPRFRYFRPGAQGRSNPQTRALSHISVVLESLDSKEVKGGSKG